ncbi:MAG: FtsX-like permease family protein [Phycisphaerales bacterium]|nr:MAG: FtsX-like permease family protein [Phycisphaerales bacterium]
MYKWFLAQRYLYTKIIVVIPIIAVTLCVAMMIVVVSVMDGFLDMVKERSRGLLSDVIVDVPTLQGFPYYEEFQAELARQLPDVVDRTTPVIYNYGILRDPRVLYTKPVRVLGIRLDEYRRINTFGEGLHYERFFPGTTTLSPQPRPVFGFNEEGEALLPAEYREANRVWRESADPAEVAEFDQRPFDQTRADRLFFAALDDQPGYEGPERHGVIIGADVIHDRLPDGRYQRVFQKGRDMTLGILPMTSTGALVGGQSASLVTLPVRYVDDSRTKVYEIDSVSVYVDFEWLQYSLMMDRQQREDGSEIPARCSQLLVSLKPGVDYNAARDRIATVWASFRDDLRLNPLSTEAQLLDLVDIQTWEERQRPFISAIEKEKVLMMVLLGLISFVSIAVVGCVFYMIVDKKTRDIGILKALGASAGGVAMTFILFAVVVGAVGSLLGAAGGSAFVYYINDIQDWLASLNPALRVWSPDVYSFDTIPNVVKPLVASSVIVIAVLASVIGAAFPAGKAGLVWPAETLRYE